METLKNKGLRFIFVYWFYINESILYISILKSVAMAAFLGVTLSKTKRNHAHNVDKVQFTRNYGIQFYKN